MGHDPPLSSPELAAPPWRVCRGGMPVLDLGLCTTPAMFMTTLPRSLDATAAVMIAASTCRGTRNGMKFFTPSAGLSKADIKAVLGMCGHAPGDSGLVEETHYLSRYAGGLVKASVKRPGSRAAPRAAHHRRRGQRRGRLFRARRA